MWRMERKKMVTGEESQFQRRQLLQISFSCFRCARQASETRSKKAGKSNQELFRVICICLKVRKPLEAYEGSGAFGGTSVVYPVALAWLTVFWWRKRHWMQEPESFWRENFLVIGRSLWMNCGEKSGWPGRICSLSWPLTDLSWTRQFHVDHLQ